MDRGARAFYARLIGSWAAAVFVVGAVALLAPAVTPAAAAETTWLCKPGLASNPCESQRGNHRPSWPTARGSIERAQPAEQPADRLLLRLPDGERARDDQNANLK